MAQWLAVAVEIGETLGEAAKQEVDTTRDGWLFHSDEKSWHLSRLGVEVGCTSATLRAETRYKTLVQITDMFASPY